MHLLAVIAAIAHGQALNEWNPVGGAASDGYVIGNHALTTDACGNPVVAYSSLTHNNELVVRLRDRSVIDDSESGGGAERRPWIDLGASAAHRGAIRYPQLGLASSGEIVCAFQGQGEGDDEKAFAIAWSKSSGQWRTLGEVVPSATAGGSVLPQNSFPHPAAEISMATAPTATHANVQCDVFVAFLDITLER